MQNNPKNTPQTSHMIVMTSTLVLANIKGLTQQRQILVSENHTLSSLDDVVNPFTKAVVIQVGLFGWPASVVIQGWLETKEYEHIKLILVAQSSNDFEFSVFETIKHHPTITYLSSSELPDLLMPFLADVDFSAGSG